VFRTRRVYVVYLAIPHSACCLTVVNHKFRNIVMHSLGFDVVVLETVEMHRKRSGRAQYCAM